MGLSGDLAGIVPATVTYAQAEAVWRFGVECEEAAIAKGDGLLWDDPGQQTRKNNLEKLLAWEYVFTSDPGSEMDYGVWNDLRTQVFGAASDLEAMGEVDDAFYRRLAMLGTDLATGAKEVAKTVAWGAGTIAVLALVGLGLYLLAGDA
jgi:hypothetical protein